MVPLAIAIFMSSVPKGFGQVLALAGCVLGLLALGLTLLTRWVDRLRRGHVRVVLRLARLEPPAAVASRARHRDDRLVVVVLIPLSGLIAGRLLGDDHGAASGRVPLIEISLQMIRDHPLFGLGANNFIIALPHYTGPEFSSDWLNVVHNRYLLIWTEAGIGALVAFVLFLVTTVRNGWRARHPSGPTGLWRCDRSGRSRGGHGRAHELRHLPPRGRRTRRSGSPAASWRRP